MPSSSADVLILQDVGDDEISRVSVQQGQPRKIEDLLNERIGLAQQAIDASVESQLSSLRDVLEAGYSNLISGSADRMEALANELQQLRRENKQLREALGAGPTVVKVMPARRPADMSHVEDYPTSTTLPGAIQPYHEKMHPPKTNKMIFYVDGSERVPVPSNILADRVKPSLPSTKTINDEVMNYITPSTSAGNHKSHPSTGSVRFRPSSFLASREDDDLSSGVSDTSRRMEDLESSRHVSEFRDKVADNVKSHDLDRRKSRKAVFADVESMKEKVRQAICEDTYDVCDFYKTTGCSQYIARSPVFDNFMLIIIAANAVWIGYDTDYNNADSLYDAPWVFIVAENAFCIIFLFEWVVRFLAFELKSNTLKDVNFVFDTVLVVFMVGETWLTNIVIKVVLPSNSTSNSSGAGNASILKLVRLIRITRIARMARLLRAMPELMILVKGMAVAMRSVMFTLGLMVVILYVFGIAFTQLAKDTAIEEKFFSNVGSSMNTLLNHATFLEGMPEVINEIGAEAWYFRALFLLHILLASLTVLNMLVGVLVEVVSVVSAVEKEQLQVNLLKAQLSRIIQEQNLDADNNGLVSKEEFQCLLENPEATRALHDVGVDVVGLVDFQDFFFVDDSTLTFVQFMELVLSLRGTNKATVKDIVDVRKFMRGQLASIEEKLAVLAGGQRPMPRLQIP